MSKRLSVLGRFTETVREYGLLPEGSRVLVAVSGGADSVCLLDLLRLVQPRLGLRLAAFHLNHGLRETAARDESFVRTLCRDWRVELVVARADVAGRACEAAQAGHRGGRARTALSAYGTGSAEV
ncbi:MAG: hypothetical protein NTX53_06330 [candidate division WOR-3 bacterium]|nr:hypothetical protein [candidate division WOR-3 bacterium]